MLNGAEILKSLLLDYYVIEGEEVTITPEPSYNFISLGYNPSWDHFHMRFFLNSVFNGKNVTHTSAWFT